MDGVEFILIIAVFAAVLIWYLANLHAGSEGAWGFLALADDPEETKHNGKRAAYRLKKRRARRACEMRDATRLKDAATEAKPAYRTLDDKERMRRKFRRQDEARYRVKDKTPSR